MKPFTAVFTIIAVLSLLLPLRAESITVYPTSASLEIGSTLQCTAYVPLSPNGVAWSVNGQIGGSTQYGTISQSGLYTPPLMIPTNNTVTVGARSTAYPTIIGISPITITRKNPSLWSVYPASLQAGNYHVSLNGANFAPDSVVTINGQDVPSTYVSPTSITVNGSATVGNLVFAVRQPGPGAITGNGVTVKVTASVVTVSISPTTATVALGSTKAFAATVQGNVNTGVLWQVNGVTGGTAITGTISTSGVYTAPGILPTNATITVTAVSAAVPTSKANATVTLVLPPPPPVSISITPTNGSVQYGLHQTFTATVLNSTNTAVKWSVNGIQGGSSTVGLITPGGVYTAPAAPPGSSSVTIQATAAASSSATASATVNLTAPPPKPVWLTGARFLEQSSFGPSPATLAQIDQIGINAFLQQQFSLPPSPIYVPADNSMGELQQWLLYNYTTAPDQLRQRVAYALSQILVTSAQKLVYADEIIPWLNVLQTNAFGNYRQLLRDISTCPSMGKYLDLANSMKPGMSGGANENYARELMQLFTIGLWALNNDGSQVLDPNTQQPIPTYDQSTVAQVALALTGWTYATAPGATPQPANWEYFGAPMEPRPTSHDMTAKTILGTQLPTNQSPAQDLDGLLDILFQHPNLPPFIATRLIRSLVTSNPTPGYIQRVSQVFINNGAGVRGDLKAVITAILMDSEARNDTPTLNGGRLKEPILQISGFLRALGGAYSQTEGLTYLYDEMAQMPISAPSVFSWYSPLYRIPGSLLFGPEFQVYTSSEAVIRGNVFYGLLTNPGTDASIDLTPFAPYGYDMAGLVEAANQALLYGRMDPGLKNAIINAATPGYDAQTRIFTALYLTALSGQYAVQY